MYDNKLDFWGSVLCSMVGCTGASNTKRLKKVIYKSVRLCMGLELESPSHMLHVMLYRHRSRFSKPLIPLQCTTEHYKKYLLPFYFYFSFFSVKFFPNPNHQRYMLRQKILWLIITEQHDTAVLTGINIYIYLLEVHTENNTMFSNSVTIVLFIHLTVVIMSENETWN